jgi:nucleotide-binding universal stress UspA family protein
MRIVKKPKTSNEWHKMSKKYPTRVNKDVKRVKEEKQMYEKVLWAADGSEESRAAARAVNDFIEKGIIKQMVILNVATNFAGSSFEMTSIRIGEMNQIAQEFGREIIKEMKGILRGEVEITEKVVLGDPAHTICEEAKENGCDMIIMGSRGKNPVSGLLLGSVSTRVLQFAHCPVLIVKK